MPTAVPAGPAGVLTTTTAPPAAAVPVAFIKPTATAVPQVASEPTAVPTMVSTPETDPYLLARQILEQADFSTVEGWLVSPCEGEAAALCIGDEQGHVGYAELLIYPLSGYGADHPLLLAAAELPPEPAAYTVEHVAAARQALASLADEHLAVLAADRAFTFPDSAFTPLSREPAQMGALPAMAFGFVHADEQDTVQERYVNVTAFDQQFLYWLGINYLRGNESGFASEEAIEQFTPVLHELAAHLPIHTLPPAGDESPPLLPALTSYREQSDELPADMTWVLAADLPQAPTVVDVLSQPTQLRPLTAGQAAAVAATYGFDKPLYVEAHPGLTVEEASKADMFAVFDGSRSLSLTTSTLFFYSDVANWRQGFDLPFAEAAPIAERFLQANGWLTFPYTVAESTQGEGVLFLPIIDGVQLLSPAYGVRVAGNGAVSSALIHVLDDLTSRHAYPIITAEEAWTALQGEQQGTAVFYRHLPPVMEAVAEAPQPVEYSNIPTAGEQGDVYTNIWAYRPLDGNGPPLVISSDFFRIRGGADLLNELAGQSEYLVHLWGTVLEPQPGLLELALSRWEVNKDAGGLPMFFGSIEQRDGETLLVDDANAAAYVLPQAPRALAAGDYAAIAGVPETDGAASRLIWQKITVYPPQPQEAPQPTAVSVQTVTIDAARLVYLRQHAGATGLDENLFIPAWEFSGLADGGARVTVWVTAVKSEFFGS